MFTGPLPNEGKTLTAINLAIAISQKVGQTVLLVDGDLRNPSIHRYLDLPSGPGLIDFLTSGYPIADSLVHPEGLANLVVLPAGQPRPRFGRTSQFSPDAGISQGIETFLSGPLRPV